MKLMIVPFEERILLDAAGMTQVSYELEHVSDQSHADDPSTQTEQPGAVHANTDAVDGRVLVISSQITDASILADAANDNTTVITYDFNTSLADLAQSIGDAFGGKQATSIGFALMGADGQFAITSDVYVSLQTLHDNTDLQSFWIAISGMVQNGGSIDILSCDVGGNTNGLSLISQLDALVDDASADHYITVNASSDKTGSADLGGNWMLEVGNVDALDRYFDSTRIQEWHGLLDAPLLVFDINTGAAASNPANFTQLGNLTFFTATTTGAGNELWVTDGTAGGTVLVKDIFSGTTGSNISNMVTRYGDSDYVYFIASSSGLERSLWRSDGTLEGTTQVSDINTSLNDTVSGLISMRNDSILVFAATTTATGNELFKYDGTSVSLVRDIRTSLASSTPTLITAGEGGMVYFVANNGISGSELWAANISSGGVPYLVQDIVVGSGSSNITNMFAPLGASPYKIFFTATSSAATGAELWRSTGLQGASQTAIIELNPGSASSSPSNFYQLGGTLMFTATNATTGRELYGLNLSNASYQVFDINPGSDSSNPLLPASNLSSSSYSMGTYIVIAATTATNGTELWRVDTNGDANGAITSVSLLSDIIVGSGSSNPTNIIPGVGNSGLVPGGATWYFTATSAAGGTEIWATNGTTEGTVQLGDINLNAGSSNPSNLFIADNKLFFAADNGSIGAELWSSTLYSIPVGSNKTYAATEDTVSNVDAANGVLNGATDPEGDSLTAVLVTNGTKGTVILNSDGSFTYTPSADQNGEDTFVFRVSDSFGNLSLRYTVTINIASVNDGAPVSQDGTLTTAQGINQFGQLVATDVDFDSLTYSIVSNPAFGVINLNTVTGAYSYTPTAGYFGMDSFTFRTNDGTVNSNTATVNITVNEEITFPQMLLDANSGAAGSDPANFTQVGSLIYFTATTAANGNELWVTDGTTAGTHIVADIRVGTNGSNATNLVELNGTLYFVATSTGAEFSLWKYDGVNAPSQVANINSTQNDTVNNIMKVGTNLYFIATTAEAGIELWRYDGSTFTNYDIYPGTANSTPSQLVTDGTKLYFVANTQFEGVELYTLDASGAPYLVKDIFVPNGLTSGITSLTIINGDAYFSARDTVTNGFELWKSTGELENATMISNINPVSSGSSTPSNFTAFNGQVYFTATNGTNGIELWVTDGITATMVKDINLGSLNSSPANLVVAGDKLFFSANVGATGVELWVSDGTSAGTTMVKNINAGSTSSNPTSIIAYGDKVYFTATNGATNGIELWVSDGTDAGTTMVMDINAGGSSSSPSSLTRFGNQLYFSATTSAYGTETWIYDAALFPVAANASPSTVEDTPLNGTLTGTDPDSTVLTYSIVTGAANGTVIITNAATGAYTYTPNANYNGTDSFTFNINDGVSDSNTATVNITITAVNDAPVPPTGALNYTTNEDTTLNGSGLLTGASDAEGDALTAELAAGGDPVNGSVTINPDGSFVYIPGANFNGADSFTYLVNDGQLNSITKTVFITINAVNDAPVLLTGALDYTTNEDTTLNGSGLLTGASDVEGDALTAALAAGGDPVNGSVTVNPDGTFVYIPGTNFNGTDSFTYVANDGQNNSIPKTVFITVNAVNDAPIAQSGVVSINEDAPVSGAVSISDVDTATEQLVALVVQEPTHGILILNGDGTYTYTPASDYNGIDSFTYKVNDGFLDSTTETISFTVNAVNDAPVVTDAAAITDEDTALSGTLAGTVTDIDSASVTYSIVNHPAFGTLVIDSNTGAYTYTPNADYNGSDSFTFKANDGTLDSNTATVNLTVNAVNDAPIAQDITLKIDGNSEGDGTIIWTDIDSTVVTVSLVNGPSHGTLALNSDGTFTYRPNADYSGMDTFTYVVNDGQLDSQPQQITIEIAAIPPTQSDRASVPLDSQYQAPIQKVVIPDASVREDYVIPQETSSNSDVNAFTEMPSQQTLQTELSLPAVTETSAELPIILDDEHTFKRLSDNRFVTQHLLNPEINEANYLQYSSLENDVILKFLYQKIFHSSPDQDALNQILLGAGLIPVEIINVATIRERGSTYASTDVFQPSASQNSANRIDRIADTAQKSLRVLSENNGIHATHIKIDKQKLKKFYLIKTLLDSLDMSFSRISDVHVAKEGLRTSQENRLKRGVDLTQFGEEHLQSYVEGLEKICEIEFPIDQFNIKEALAVEVLTKYIIAQTLEEGFSFPFPHLQGSGKEIIIHYVLKKSFRLGTSEIPVYFFEAKEKSMAPILVFRATRMNFNTLSDANSIVENLNSSGPARGFYKEFEPFLKQFLEHRFENVNHTEKLRIFGYSQGGVLGQRALIDFAKFMQNDPDNHSIFFNSPGIEKDYLDKWNNLDPADQPTVVNYLTTRDAISKVGAGFIGDVYEITPSKENKVLEAHFGVRFLEDNWKVYKVDKEKEVESETRKILNAIQASCITGGIYLLASKSVGSMFAQAHRNLILPRSAKGIDTNFSFNAHDSLKSVEISEQTLALLSTNQKYTIFENGILSVSASGLLSLYPQHRSETLLILDDEPLHGVLHLHTNGAFDYTPNKGYSGSDSFRVKFDDKGVLSDSILVEITINKAVNPLPHLETSFRKLASTQKGFSNYNSNISLTVQDGDFTKVYHSFAHQDEPKQTISNSEAYQEMMHDKIVENAVLSPADRLPAVEELALTTVITQGLIHSIPETMKPLAKMNIPRYIPEFSLYSKSDITIAAFAIQEDLRRYLRDDLNVTELGEVQSAPDKVLKAVKDEANDERWR